MIQLVSERTNKRDLNVKLENFLKIYSEKFQNNAALPDITMFLLFTIRFALGEQIFKVTIWSLRPPPPSEKINFRQKNEN